MKIKLFVLILAIVLCCGFTVTNNYKFRKDTVYRAYRVEDDGTLTEIWNKQNSIPAEPNEVITNDFALACMLTSGLSESEREHLIEHTRLLLNSQDYVEALKSVENLPSEMKSLYVLLCESVESEGE